MAVIEDEDGDGAVGGQNRDRHYVDGAVVLPEGPLPGARRWLGADDQARTIPRLAGDGAGERDLVIGGGRVGAAGLEDPELLTLEGEDGRAGGGGGLEGELEEHAEAVGAGRRLRKEVW